MHYQTRIPGEPEYKETYDGRTTTKEFCGQLYTQAARRRGASRMAIAVIEATEA